jgi:hypothetical protein
LASLGTLRTESQSVAANIECSAPHESEHRELHVNWGEMMPFTLARARFATGEPGRDRGAIRCHVPGEMFSRCTTYTPFDAARADPPRLVTAGRASTVGTPDPGRPLSFVDTEARVHLRCSFGLTTSFRSPPDRIHEPAPRSRTTFDGESQLRHRTPSAVSTHNLVSHHVSWLMRTVWSA